MANIAMDRFRETFFDEAQEHLATMETSLLALEDAPDDRESMDMLFRAAHSIKGSGGTFGLTDITRFSHALETLLDLMRNGTLDTTPERIDLLLVSCDVLGSLVYSTRNGSQPPDEVETVLCQINEMLGVDGESSDSKANEESKAEKSTGMCEYQVRFIPGEDTFRQGLNPLMLLLDLGQLGEVIETLADFTRLPNIDQLDPESSYLAWNVRLWTSRSADEIKDVFMFVDDQTTVEIVELSDDSANKRQTLDVEEKRSQGLRYLIVDDDPDCCLLLEDILSDYGRGHCVYDGTEAILALRLALEDERPYDLICLDILMPNKNGHDTLEEIRALEAEFGILGLRGTKVVMTTSIRESRHLILAFNAGCEDYIIKPVNEDEMFGKLRELGLELVPQKHF